MTVSRSTIFCMVCLSFALAMFGPVEASADSTDRWTQAATVAATIGPCLTTTGDDQPSKARPCSRKFIAACTKAGDDTTQAMRECGDAAVRYWRSVVNHRTAGLLARHDNDVTAYVRHSDPVWKQYVAQRCAMYALLQGTVWGPAGIDCVLQTTIDRADDLDTLRINAPSGA